MKGLFKLLGVVLLIALVAGGVLYTSFVTVVEVGHNAMAPTMTLGDRVLVWRTDKFELGQVALCAHPGQPGNYVIGRVVGRPGQTVAIERGQLLIAGEAPPVDIRDVVVFDDAELGRPVRMRRALEDLLDRDHFIFTREGDEPRMRRAHSVRSGLFLMNDNRTHRGEDSRTYGEVDPNSCVGRVFMRLTAAPATVALGGAALDILK